MEAAGNKHRTPAPALDSMNRGLDRSGIVLARIVLRAKVQNRDLRPANRGLAYLRGSNCRAQPPRFQSGRACGQSKHC